MLDAWILPSRVVDPRRKVLDLNCEVQDLLLEVVAGPILSVFPALIVQSELKSVHPGFPVAFIF